MKICDLGQARSFRKAIISAAVGTAAYMPPESFDEQVTNDRTYAASSWDVYSLAIMLWQLWYRKEPWKGMSTHKIYAKLIKGKRPAFDDPAPPPPLRSIIEHMWHQDHATRPTLREACVIFEKDVYREIRSIQDEPDTPNPFATPGGAVMPASPSLSSSFEAPTTPPLGFDSTPAKEEPGGVTKKEGAAASEEEEDDAEL